MKLSEVSQPMREANLIELIESLPKSHLARVEYTRLLGRLSHEKNESLEIQQHIQELETELFNTESKAYNETEDKLVKLEDKIDELEKESAELKEDLIETQRQLSKTESELEEFQSFFVDADACYELEDKSLSEWLAQHDKEVIKSFVKECKNSDKLTGIEKLTLHALMIKHFQSLEPIQEQD